jgi:hypothetical protein
MKFFRKSFGGRCVLVFMTPSIVRGMLFTGLLLVAAAVTAQAGLADHAHPRLWFPRSSEAAVRESLRSDPLAAKLHAALMIEADKVLAERVCRYEIPDGKRLLGESRRALHNIMHAGWAWRITGEEKYRARVIAELEAACGLKDWNPSHFLDTAEMAAAVATGYDWLHATLSPQQRAMCESAILEKALKPALKIYEQGGWWARPHNNWAQVCGAGISIAAAAIADSEPAMAEDLFHRGLKLVESCRDFYQPDGMYPEGPGYWHYGTNYHVMMLAACAPLGVGIAKDDLIRKAGLAMMHLTGPTRLSFNFADGNARSETPSPAQFWLASHFKDPVQVAHVRGLLARALDEGKGRLGSDRYMPLALLWFPRADSAKVDLPKAAVFGGQQAVAAFRSGWGARDAYFAIKGGTPAASHGHMDVGAFVYDAHGLRWFHDFGSEDYNLPGYFGSKRWEYYRLQNRSHNTLEIAGTLQNPKSKPCQFSDAVTSGSTFSATLDLCDAYRNSASKVTRRVRFNPADGAVRIDDEITSPQGSVVWRAFTDADAVLDGDAVVLRKSGREIRLRAIGSGKWRVDPATPPTAAEHQNARFKAVVLEVPKAELARIQVLILPGKDES